MFAAVLNRRLTVIAAAWVVIRPNVNAGPAALREKLNRITFVAAAVSAANRNGHAHAADPNVWQTLDDTGCRERGARSSRPTDRVAVLIVRFPVLVIANKPLSGDLLFKASGPFTSRYRRRCIAKATAVRGR